MERDERPPHQPFEIVVTLATPVALNHPWLHLDGVLAHLVHQRVLGRAFYELPTKTMAPLPREQQGRWANALGRFRPIYGHYMSIPSASVSLFEDSKKGTVQYFKRFEADGFPRPMKVYQGHGHYRNWMLRTLYESCRLVRFYGCGQVDLVRELLEDLTALGDNVRQGWGKIATLELRAVDEDWSVTRDGVAQRPIPVQALKTWSDSVPLAWRPTYWNPANVAECAPPGAAVTL